MNRHLDVNCNVCQRNDFTGLRYKCLRCYDYDLCAKCYDASAKNAWHESSHAMQCIVAPGDFELYYGGEPSANGFQAQSYTCPFCGRMGFTEITLLDHILSDHLVPTVGVVCPVCAAVPFGNSNHVTEDFAGHLVMDHGTRPTGHPGGCRPPDMPTEAPWSTMNPIAELLSQPMQLNPSAQVEEPEFDYAELIDLDEREAQRSPHGQTHNSPASSTNLLVDVDFNSDDGRSPTPPALETWSDESSTGDAIQLPEQLSQLQLELRLAFLSPTPK